jgi:hypothetical protein
MCSQDPLLNLFFLNCKISHVSIKLQHRAPEHLLSRMNGVRSHPHLINVNFLTLMVGFFQVFPMNVKVGGVAMNSTIASHVFLMDPWWNPIVEQKEQNHIHCLRQYKPMK